MLVGLDALRDRDHVEAAADLQDAADQLGVTGLGQLRNERPVDLQDVDGKSVQVCKRGVSGAEVVDGELDAELLEPGQLREVLLGVLEQNRLGHLQLEAARREPRLRQRVDHIVDEIVVLELAGRQVHAH